MTMTDPVADMLTRLRNANMVYHDMVDIPSAKLKVDVAEILKEEGYIKGYKIIKDRKQGVLRINMKYTPNRERVINRIERISKPGRRIYVNKDEIPHVLNGLGIAILSTSKGVLSDKEARHIGAGGEVLCYVW